MGVIDFINKRKKEFKAYQEERRVNKIDAARKEIEYLRVEKERQELKSAINKAQERPQLNNAERRIMLGGGVTPDKDKRIKKKDYDPFKIDRIF
jgi:hypothetical protein